MDICGITINIKEPVMRCLAFVSGNNNSFDFLFFVFITAICGSVVVILDWFYTTQIDGKNSFLGLSHTEDGPKVKQVLLWAFCSAVCSYLFVIFEIVTLKMRSAIAVSILWPVILPKFIKSVAMPKVFQKKTKKGEKP
jgi:hypothetical protein